MGNEQIKFIALVSIFGVGGVLARLLAATLIAPRNSGFPLATLCVNLLGCLLIGFLYSSAVLARGWIGEETAKALAIGLLGGFTTFSSFSLETLNLLQAGKYFLGISYLVGSPVIGLLFTSLGMSLGERI